MQTLTNGGLPAPATCLSGVSFTGETNNLGIVGPCCPIGGAEPGIRFTESNDPKQTGFACPPAATPVAGGALAASQQFGVTQTDLFTIDQSGEMSVTWAFKDEPWSEPITTTGGIFPAGAPVVASQQFGTSSAQTDVFAVDKNGTLQVTFVSGAGQWQGPAAIGAAGLFPAGAHLAASQQFGTTSPQTDVFMVDKNGALQVAYVVGAGSWHTLALSSQGLFPPGAPVAASQQFGTSSAQTDVFVVDNSGRLNVFYVVGGGAWHGPVFATGTGKFAKGANLAASQQFGTPSPQTDVFGVDVSGNLTAVWVVNAGAWNVSTITSGAAFASGVPVAASRQFGLNQTDVFAVSKAGNVTATAVAGAGAWLGPIDISGGNQFASGAAVAASQQAGDASTTDVFAITKNNLRVALWVIGSGAWSGTWIP